MKENYIRQVSRKLAVSEEQRREILRDLEEIFASALEHGETEEQVIDRLGSPKSFVDKIHGELDVRSAEVRRKKKRIRVGAALLAAVILSAAGILIRMGRTPEDIIGQADAMTSVKVSGSGLDPATALLLLGMAALAAAVAMILRYVRGK